MKTTAYFEEQVLRKRPYIERPCVKRLSPRHCARGSRQRSDTSLERSDRRARRKSPYIAGRHARRRRNHSQRLFRPRLPKGQAMKLHYYPETDSLYIELKAEPAMETREVAQRRPRRQGDLRRPGHRSRFAEAGLVDARNRRAARPLPPRSLRKGPWQGIPRLENRTRRSPIGRATAACARRSPTASTFENKPDIQVIDVDLLGDRELVLRHTTRKGVGPAEAGKEATLRHFRRLWGYAVRLEETPAAPGGLSGMTRTDQPKASSDPITSKAMIRRASPGAGRRDGLPPLANLDAPVTPRSPELPPAARGRG